MPQRKRRKRQKTSWVIPAAVVAVIVIAVVIVIFALPHSGEPEPTQPQGTGGTKVEYVEMDPIDLGQGLVIDYAGAYTGIYMEDGTNEMVTGLMMVILKNTGNQDLQLARFTLEYADFTAEFEVTNLPAGASVVTLEKNRRDAAGEPKSAKLSTVVFFQEKMTLLEEQLELSGSAGTISVKNISGADISGNIWVYYKYSATDIFYGGITFRAKLTDGLKAGESAQIPAGHYNPNSVKIVCVTVEGEA